MENLSLPDNLVTKLLCLNILSQIIYFFATFCYFLGEVIIPPLHIYSNIFDKKVTVNILERFKQQKYYG